MKIGCRSVVKWNDDTRTVRQTNLENDKKLDERTNAFLDCPRDFLDAAICQIIWSTYKVKEMFRFNFKSFSENQFFIVKQISSEEKIVQWQKNKTK